LSSNTAAWRRRRIRRVSALCALVALLALVALTAPWRAGTSLASGQAATGEVSVQTDASVPAESVLMLGSSPQEAPGETWGIGRLGLGGHAPTAVVRYEAGAGWTLAPTILDGEGRPLGGFVPDETGLAGSVTPTGAAAVLGRAPESSAPNSPLKEMVLVRAPGHAFQQTASEAPLTAPERLFSGERTPLVTALEEGEGHAGVLIVPESKEPEVLHWNGSQWSSEPIEVPTAAKEAGGFRALGLAASSPGNAWLLARLSSQSGAVALFRRAETGEGSFVWRPVSPAPGASPGAPIEANGEQLEALSSTEVQQLAVTSQGVWVDGGRPGGSIALTLFFKPGEEEGSGEVIASWCAVPPGAEKHCDHVLPEPLPTGQSRTFAWAEGAGQFGGRVITGLTEGDTMRLEADGEYALVLGKGEGVGALESVAHKLGAAFSSPTEGWLGNLELPVHLTQSPEPNRLENVSVPFRKPLLAIAPQPGVPVGALSSQALAVGVEGQVARFVPGSGPHPEEEGLWKPESLLDPSGGKENPELRAVAWPSPSRAYAVGVPVQGKLDQMWLWRGETGLWEPDPAEPPNLRADLLGVAFEYGNPARGYVVGQQGALLRYGKSWTAEQSCEVAPQPCLPLSVAAIAKTSFTSVAFAGPEALVAYRTPSVSFEGGHEGAFSYSGGILVNSGGEWKLDEGASQALEGGIPWAVAGLPDGGAAISAESAGGGQPLVLEREGAGASWRGTPEPYPGFTEPGSLALFREAGALRVIGSGGAPATIQTDSQAEPPAGAPPNLGEPYPLAELGGDVLRQTATGWRDEEHEHTDGGPPPGQYAMYDEVYEPDPIAAVMVNETGTAGWGAGGVVPGAEKGAQTADIVRYPAEGKAPAAHTPIETPAGDAEFAIGGGAQCRSTCALRARAGIGPDVWLSDALGVAASVPNVRAFLYAGPRVSTGKTTGAPQEIFPYERELARYGSLLSDSPLPVLAAASESELDFDNECPFAELVSASVAPRGTARSNAELVERGEGGEACGEAHAYYSYESRPTQTSGASGGLVRVIVLDQAGEADAAEQEWLAGELKRAGEFAQAAIVLGSVTPVSGKGLACTLDRGNASAYFFYVPEENLASTAVCAGSTAVPAYGTGTLGYVLAQNAETQDFIGQSGILIASIGAYSSEAKRAPVTVQLTPEIGELAIEAIDGTLLRRSHAALFTGLARRPRAGNEALQANERRGHRSDAYIPISQECIGALCASGIQPEFTFESSEPSVGDFVKRNLQAEARAVLLNGAGVPEADPHSALFCAFNPGETTVKLKSGGLEATMRVLVQNGSVRRPCGTVPAKNVPAKGAEVPPPVAPSAASPTPSPNISLNIVPPPPPSPAASTPAAVAAAPVFTPALTPVPLPVIVPPPLPAPNPTPPSGTSPVTSPVEAAQKEEEKEEATESVSNQAVAYHPSEHEPAPAYLLGLIALAALAGVSIRRRPGRRRRDISLAHVTVSSRTARDWRQRRPW
jgi:hypothetical protein